LIPFITNNNGIKIRIIYENISFWLFFLLFFFINLNNNKKEEKMNKDNYNFFISFKRKKGHIYNNTTTKITIKEK
jgi:hypothetical protein